MRPGAHVHERAIFTCVLLERDEARRVGRTNAGTAVADGFIRAGEFTEVVPHHFGLNFNTIEELAVIDGHNRADHFWHDKHIS